MLHHCYAGFHHRDNELVPHEPLHLQLHLAKIQVVLDEVQPGLPNSKLAGTLATLPQDGMFVAGWVKQVKFHESPEWP